jgi:hypothetical protein
MDPVGKSPYRRPERRLVGRVAAVPRAASRANVLCVQRRSVVHMDLDNPIVPPKVDKLVRRGPRAYFIVGNKPDGSPVEIRLTAVSFHMEGDERTQSP